MKIRGLRVGLVGPLPPPSGGMANQTLQLANLLQIEGCVVKIIQVNKPYRPSFVAKIPIIRALFRFIPYLIRLWRSAKGVDLYHVMANSGWSWHLFAAPVIWIGWLAGKPVVINYRGGEADNFLTQSHFWIRPSLQRADALIVPSGYLEAIFEKHGFVAKVVPNIINLSRFSPNEKTFQLKGDAPCILVARNLEKIYDNATALHAFKIVRKTMPFARLIIAGSGPERGTLETLAKFLEIADATTFTGRVSNEEMANLYLEADVMVNASLVDNMPNSLLEALACGVPVVSTNVGGVPYMVEDEKTALLVPPSSPEIMATAILRLLCDPIKANQLKQEGIQLVQQYTWPRVRERLLNTYAHALFRKSNR